MTLTLNFQGQICNSLYLNQKWCDCHETKSNHINWSQGINYDHLVWLWPWPWPWIWNLLYLCQKWSVCHETKSKYIDWILGLKCDHQIWPWPWPWPWHFKVKYGICCISTKSGPIAMKQKANISIQLQVSNVTNGFDLGHDLDIWIFKVKCDLNHLVTKVRCKDLPDSEWPGWLQMSACRRLI